MIYVFLIGFIAVGIYYIVKGLKEWKGLDSEDDDYEKKHKKSMGYFLLGLLFIGLAIYNYYTRIVLWGWG